MLTRRIGLELIVPQYPALARALAPSEQGSTQDETSAGPFSTSWEQPVESGPPRRSNGQSSVRRARGPASPRCVLQHRRHLGRSGSPSPSRGKARGGPRSRTSCASGAGSPGGLGNGAQAPGGAGLSSRRVHELATEGAGATWIGVSASHPRDPHRSTSSLVACPAKADLALAHESSASVTTARSVTLLLTVFGEASTSLDTPRQPGSTVIQGCARGLDLVANKALWAEEARCL